MVPVAGGRHVCMHVGMVMHGSDARGDAMGDGFWLLRYVQLRTYSAHSTFAFTEEEEEGRVSLHMPLDAVAANYRHEVLTAPQAHVKVLSGLCPSFAN